VSRGKNDVNRQQIRNEYNKQIALSTDIVKTLMKRFLAQQLNYNHWCPSVFIQPNSLFYILLLLTSWHLWRLCLLVPVCYNAGPAATHGWMDGKTELCEKINTLSLLPALNT